MTRLSHSAIEKYKTCPMMYKLHYKDRLRSTHIGSPLFFGGAVDEALNVLLLTKKDDLNDEEAELVLRDPFEEFDDRFTNINLNGETVDIRESLLPQYSKTDFDGDLLTDLDRKILKTKLDVNPVGFYEEYQAGLKCGTEYKEKEHKFVQFMTWLSLRRKGHMMISTYHAEVMPILHKVHSIQKMVNLPNAEGDTIIGYIDFEAEFVGEEGVVYTVDNKTSARKYAADSVRLSQQLSLYDEFTQNGKAAYVVLLKKLRKIKHKTCKTCGAVTTRAVKTCAEKVDKKRCGGDFDVLLELKIDTQVVKDDIEESFKGPMFDGIEDVLESINQESFEPDYDNCFQYGRPCVYANLCKEGCKEGLVEL